MIFRYCSPCPLSILFVISPVVLKLFLSISKTLINLTNKILVFLKPPDKEVRDILQAILSHDSLEIEFPFVNDNKKA